MSFRLIATVRKVPWANSLSKGNLQPLKFHAVNPYCGLMSQLREPDFLNNGLILKVFALPKVVG